MNGIIPRNPSFLLSKVLYAMGIIFSARTAARQELCMALDNITIRESKLEDLESLADLYCTLWTNSLRNRGDFEDAMLAGRYNIAMQFQRSPIALVAEHDGEPIAACCVGIFDKGMPRTNPYWQERYDELLALATERAKDADECLEGCLFGDTREKATADRFAATGNEYAQGQINLIIIRPEWQGKGLGRALIDRARTELHDAGCTKFFLMSDNRSDHEFYDHIGMTRIAEDHSQDTGDGFIVYVYGDEA